jgi:hypothetical protein
MNVRFGIGIATVSLLGCTHLGALKEKAGRDLSCSPDQVEILNAGKTRDVEACGKRATYHWTGAHWMRQEKPTVTSTETSSGTVTDEKKASPPSPPPQKEQWQ